MWRRGLGFSVWLLAAGGCMNHQPVSFRARLAVGDRGIFVPLPPPSYLAAPIQSAQVDASIEGAPVDAGVVVRLIDTQGEADLEVVAPAEGELPFPAFETDLRDNCIELWIEADDGAMGTVTRLHTEIVSDTELLTVHGCDD